MYSVDLSEKYFGMTAPILDSSFAEIHWQAPWMAHISQLRYLSRKVHQFSQAGQQSATTLKGQGEDKTDFGTNSATNSSIIANVLNNAMQQKANDSHHQPQTKPALDNQAQPLRFVSQDELPEGVGYEYFIGNTGNIPTRENLHDLLNGSIWLTFPKTKALLNYHHMLAMTEQNKGATSRPKNNIPKSNISKNNRPNNPRGRVRDTITVFDENGAILVTADERIGHALIDFNWQDSLVTPRKCWDNPLAPRSDAKAAVYIFGHALLEQLVEPRKSLCSHSVVIHVTPDFFALSMPEKMRDLDHKLADYMHHLLSQDSVTPRQLSPLPLLGVPHFWADNLNPDFYDDSRVFRSGRRQSL